MSELPDNVILITGASGGIGRACVEAFTAAGARVVMTDIDPAGRDLAAELGEARCRFVEADVTDEEHVHRIIGTAVEVFGGLDVLVNNAACCSVDEPVHTTSQADFDRLISVNVKGPFMLCKHAYPHLCERSGCIVNVSSMAGVQGERHHAVYAATKGALNSMTKSMAVDYGADGIRCNAVCPSSVLTPNLDQLIAELPNSEEMIEFRNAINLLGYTATPDQVASVVVFLAAPAAAFMTGAIVPVSGGSECGYGVR